MVEGPGVPGEKNPPNPKSLAIFPHASAKIGTYAVVRQLPVSENALNHQAIREGTQRGKKKGISFYISFKR